MLSGSAHQAASPGLKPMQIAPGRLQKGLQPALGLAQLPPCLSVEPPELPVRLPRILKLGQLAAHAFGHNRIDPQVVHTLATGLPEAELPANGPGA